MQNFSRWLPLLLMPTIVFAAINYPAAPRGDQVDDLHGTKVANPYRWLEDLDSPATQAWVAAENKETFAFLATLGNRDAIKLSGVVEFTVRDCVFEGWGGSAIDMVGCHDGLIERCRLQGVEGCSQDTGIQCKGGTSRITIRGCTLLDAGQRAINVGGSTGLEFFRPADADAEARAITVEGCRFRGSDAPIAFVGVDGAVVRRIAGTTARANTAPAGAASE